MAAGDAKRTKAGSAAAQKIEERIAFVQEYIKLWRQFFDTFSEGFEGRKIFKKDEEDFARILYSLAHHHYRFTATTQGVMGGTDAIIKILCESISLSHLKGLSEAQLSKVQLDWHTIFIDMNKALGRLISQRPLTPEEQQMAKKGIKPPTPGSAAPPEAPATAAPPVAPGKLS